MIWFNIITTLRYFIKYKSYTLVNVFGLAIGLATCIIIFLFVQDELSYDKFHKDAQNIYRLEPHIAGEGEDSHWAASQGSLIHQVSQRYPEIEASVKIHFTYNSTIFRYGEKSFREERILTADSTFFDVFSFKLLLGDPADVLTGVEKIVLTESSAKKVRNDIWDIMGYTGGFVP